MKKAVLFLGLLGGLVSCNSAPECGDKEVSKLVREIIIDNYNFVRWRDVAYEYYAEDYEKYKKEMEELKQGVRNNGYDISDDEDIDHYFSSKRKNINEEYKVKSQEIGGNYRGEIEHGYKYRDNFIIAEYYYYHYSLNSDGLAKMKELEKEIELVLAKINSEQERVDRAKEEIKGRYQWGKKEDFVRIAYKREDKIQEIINRLYPVEISNIRNVSFDKENKKCDCEATLKWVETDYLFGGKYDKSKEIYFTAQRNTDGDLYVEVMQ